MPASASGPCTNDICQSKQDASSQEDGGLKWWTVAEQGMSLKPTFWRIEVNVFALTKISPLVNMAPAAFLVLQLSMSLQNTAYTQNTVAELLSLSFPSWQDIASTVRHCFFFMHTSNNHKNFCCAIRNTLTGTTNRNTKPRNQKCPLTHGLPNIACAAGPSISITFLAYWHTAAVSTEY